MSSFQRVSRGYEYVERNSFPYCEGGRPGNEARISSLRTLFTVTFNSSDGCCGAGVMGVGDVGRVGVEGVFGV